VLAVRGALAVGLAAIGVALALTLAQAPLVVGGTNSIAVSEALVATYGGVSACQENETIPAGTTAVRLWLQGNIKSRVHVRVLAGSQTVATGVQEGSQEGKVMTVPVGRVGQTLRHARVCFAIARAVQPLELLGGPVPHPARGEPTEKMRIEYLHPGSDSWWSLIGPVARRLGIGRAPEGSLTALIPLVLMALAALLAVRTILAQVAGERRDAPPPIAGAQDSPAQTDEPPGADSGVPRPPATGQPLGGAGAQTTSGATAGAAARAHARAHERDSARGGLPAAAKQPGAAAQLTKSEATARTRSRARERAQSNPWRGRASGLGAAVRRTLRQVPGPAWACACVAMLSAASWSIVTPPFQAPDEPSHFSYAQILAETGTLPRSQLDPYSAQETTVLADLDHEAVRFNQAIGTISTQAQRRSLQRDLHLPLSRVGSGAGVATSQPPLYYALETIPYKLGALGTLLDQLELMRLLSALLAGLAAIFVFLFLREALPQAPYAWTVGGLGMALTPLVGFISGVVNPDALLCTVAAALFYCLARAFRRGLTLGRACAIGLVMAVGFTSKLNFIGLAPGVLLALVLLARRAARTGGAGGAAYRWLAAGVAIGLAPGFLYAAANALSGHAAFGLLSTSINGTGAHKGSLSQEVSYIWEFYLPRLPGMKAFFPGVSTLRQVWFDKAVGLYGWLDTYFPLWVYTFALVPAGLVAALCGRELVRSRGVLRARAGELISYGAIVAGMLVLFGAASYLETPAFTGADAEPRYLLPLAALFAAVFALAARGAGRRWGPAVGTLLVLLILAHDIFSQLLVVGRYYA
jgi:hypothetical protein